MKAIIEVDLKEDEGVADLIKSGRIRTFLEKSPDSVEAVTKVWLNGRWQKLWYITRHSKQYLRPKEFEVVYGSELFYTGSGSFVEDEFLAYAFIPTCEFMHLFYEAHFIFLTQEDNKPEVLDTFGWITLKEALKKDEDDAGELTIVIEVPDWKADNEDAP